ncbi:MAG: ClpXP protease specificity-enhancing factor SspB [Pseudomonadota bacterium]
MKPQRPYLLRALYDWIVDSGEVPYILVDATVDGVVVPTEHIQDGKIVLNIGPNAIRDLHIGDDYVMCNGRFDGRVFELCMPMLSVNAIYSKDTAQGMVFPEENALGVPVADPSAAATPATPAGVSEIPTERVAEKESDDTSDDKPGGPPTLRLV